MLFNRRDWHELVGSLKWFFNRGPRPEYGRWTYWEKFDYFAVFWGVAVIGGTGLLLWFPEILHAPGSRAGPSMSPPPSTAMKPCWR